MIYLYKKIDFPIISVLYTIPTMIMDLIKGFGIVSPEDIIMLEDTNPDTLYDCSYYTKSKGFTLLHKLILLTKKYPSLENAIKQYIILYPEEINKTNEKGWTALHLIARNGSTETLLKILLNHGANIDQQTNNGITPLMFAVRYIYGDYIHVTKILLEYGAIIDAKDNDGWTALLHAVRGHENSEYPNPCVKLLLDIGADINVQDSERCTALMYMAENSNLYSCRTIKLLLDYKADINIKNKLGNTALIIASDPDIVSLLLYYGADVNSRNSNGTTALIYLIRNNRINIETLKLLLINKADACIRNNDNLDAYIYSLLNNKIDVLELLLQFGDTLKYDKGFTLFMIAVQEKNVNAAKLLLKYENNVNMQNDNGATAMHIAILRYDDTMVDYLLSLDIDCNIKDNNGNTALHYAAKIYQDTFNIMKKIIDVGADVFIKNNKGKTPIDLCKPAVKDLVLKYIPFRTKDTIIESGNVPSCIMCLTNVAIIAIVPCNHLLLCCECYHKSNKTLDKCPVCKSRIESYSRIFF